MKNTAAVIIYAKNVIIAGKYGDPCTVVPRTSWAALAAICNASLVPLAELLTPKGFTIPTVLPSLPPGVDAIYYDPVSGESLATVEGSDTYRYNSPFSFGEIVSSNISINGEAASVPSIISAGMVQLLGG